MTCELMLIKTYLSNICGGKKLPCNNRMSHIEHLYVLLINVRFSFLSVTSIFASNLVFSVLLFF